MIREIIKKPKIDFKSLDYMKFQRKKNSPYRCPICGGTGQVSAGFYDQTSGTWISSDTSTEDCRSCGATGIVWGI